MDDLPLVRLNKRLAELGVATRREADVLIGSGRVFVNGTRAELGMKVTERDQIDVRGVRSREYIYLAYHKPRGIITHSAGEDEEEIPSIAEINGVPEKIFPVGRLDKDSSGLIILTNDGRIIDRLLNPDGDHQKVYRVAVDKPVTNHFLKWMRQGVDIEGYTTKPAYVREIGTREIEITITEGKKHQIRRMCANLGFTITSLERIRIENIELGRLAPGEFREIVGPERDEFLKHLGL